MVEARHVQQRQCERDGRSRRIRLTVSGTRLAREVNDASRARFGALLSALPPPRRSHVLGALQELVAAIETLPPNERNQR
jgi:DNA-binding MarR family transcriptional regulator